MMKNIKDLQNQILPREKLAKYGPGKLTDAELLAIILGSGTKGMNVLALSRAILKRIARMDDAPVTPDQLSSIRGLGKAKQSQVIALLELSKRLQTKNQQEILSTKDIWNMCNDFYASSKEHLVAFYLDTQSRLIQRKILSIGTLDANITHPRDVFEPALTLHAASVILAHNHPSGDTNPSNTDILLTKKLAAGAELLGLKLEDHIIVSKKNHTSMRQEALL